MKDTIFISAAPIEAGTTLPQIVGLGLLIARRRGASWQLSLRSGLALPTHDPAHFLSWLAREIPESDPILIGWDIEKMVFAPLDHIAAKASPSAASLAMLTLRRLRHCVVDLSLDHMPVGAVSLAGAAAHEKLPVCTISPDQLEQFLQDGDVAQLHRALTTNAITLWRLFLRRAGEAGAEAELAVNFWFGD